MNENPKSPDPADATAEARAIDGLAELLVWTARHLAARTAPEGLSQNGLKAAYAAALVTGKLAPPDRRNAVADRMDHWEAATASSTTK